MTGSIARNYARALFELAAETSAVDPVETDLRAARDALYTDREARAFLANRLIGRPAKKRLVRRAFEGTVDQRVLDLILLMIDRGRTILLGEVTEDYERRARIARGVRHVTLTTAFPLGAEDTARVTRALEARLASRVELEVVIDRTVVGGVVAESEGQEIEFSIEGRLKALSSIIERR